MSPKALRQSKKKGSASVKEASSPMTWWQQWILPVIPKMKPPFCQELESRLGYSFRSLVLLKQALAHKSYTFENKIPASQNNERLEFLGDAVLDLGISQELMVRLPEADEGKLSKIRSALVNEACLAKVARSVRLGEAMLLGYGEDQARGRDKESLLANALEAVLGAIYLDGGWDAAYRVVQRLFEPWLTEAQSRDIVCDYKTSFQEKAQEKFRLTPRYRLVGTSGPEHSKIFKVEIWVGDRVWAEGEGRSKKSAEQMAALKALEEITRMP